MTYIFQDQLRAYCKKHGHDWQPVSTEGSSMGMVRCSICKAMEYRL